MGLFDTVEYTCPSCGVVTEQQTKMGANRMANHQAYSDGSNIPRDLLKRLAEEQLEEPVVCEACKKKFRLAIINVPVGILVMVPEGRADGS